MKTLNELGQVFGVSNVAVYHAMKDLLEERQVVRLPGARGYTPKWAVNALAKESSGA